MDIASIIGPVMAFGLIVLGMGAFVGAFVDFPSLLIVVGGTVGVIFVFYPLESLMGLGGIIRNVFLTKPRQTSTLIATIIDFAGRARREGIVVKKFPVPAPARCRQRACSYATRTDDSHRRLRSATARLTPPSRRWPRPPASSWVTTWC